MRDWAATNPPLIIAMIMARTNAARETVGCLDDAEARGVEGVGRED
jgi:hypothetical protein